jgi:hypothetical protein
MLLPDGNYILGDVLTGPATLGMQSRLLPSGDAATPPMAINFVSAKSVTLLPDATRMIAVTSTAISLWDVERGTPIGRSWNGNGWFNKEWLKSAHLSPDLGSLTVVSDGGIVFKGKLGNVLTLRGDTLRKAVCETILPGDLEQLSPDELSATPILDPAHDKHACPQ